MFGLLSCPVVVVLAWPPSVFGLLSCPVVVVLAWPPSVFGLLSCPDVLVLVSFCDMFACALAPASVST